MDPHLSDLAACRNHPHPGWWWPEKGQNVEAVEAKRVCAQCPVLRECLEGAIASREEHGIRGGSGEALRRWLRRAWLQGGAVWEQAFETHLAKLDGDQVLVDANGVDATHGVAATYARGCRCDPCTLAVLDRGLDLVVTGDRTRSTVADLPAAPLSLLEVFDAA